LGVNLSASAQQNPTASSLRVLFIGNSYTGRHHLSLLIKEMAEAGNPGLELKVTTVTYGGGGLEDHWQMGTGNFVKLATLTIEEANAAIQELERMLEADPEHRYAGRALNLQRELQSSLSESRPKWDIVVLQDYRRRRVDYAEDIEKTTYAKYARRFAEVARAQGARVVLYETTPTMLNAEPLSAAPDPAPIIENARALGSFAKSIGAEVVPMSLVVLRCQTVRPDLTLRYTNDGHLNHITAYLTACAFQAVLFDRSPVGLPINTVTDTRFLDEDNQDKDPDGGPISRVFSPEECAEFQRIAWQSILQFRQLFAGSPDPHDSGKK